MGESDARALLLTIAGVNANVLAFAIGISLVIQQLTSSYDTAHAMRVLVRRSSTFLALYVVFGLLVPLGSAFGHPSEARVVVALALSALLWLGTIFFSNSAGRTARPEALVSLMLTRSRKGITAARRLSHQKQATEAMQRLLVSSAREHATRALWKIFDDLTGNRDPDDLLEWGGRDPVSNYADVPPGRVARWRYRRRMHRRQERDELAAMSLRRVLDCASGQDSNSAIALLLDALDHQPVHRNVGSRIVRIALSRVATDVTLDVLREGCDRSLVQEPTQALEAARVFAAVANWRMWVLCQLVTERVSRFDERQALAQRCAALASHLLLELPAEEFPREYARRSEVVSIVSALLAGSQMVVEDHEDAYVDPAITVLNESHARLLEIRRPAATHAADIALRRLRVLHHAHVAMLTASSHRSTLHLDDGKSLFAAYLDQLRRSLSLKDRAAARIQIDLLNSAISRQFDEDDLLTEVQRMVRIDFLGKRDAQRYSFFRLLVDALPEVKKINALIRMRSKRSDYLSSVEIRESLGVTYPLSAWPDRPQVADGRPDADLARLLELWSAAATAHRRLAFWTRDAIDGRGAAEARKQAELDRDRSRASLERHADSVQKGAVDPAEVRVAAWGRAAQRWLALPEKETDSDDALEVLIPIEVEDRGRRDQELALADTREGGFEFDNPWGRAHGWREPWSRDYPEGHFERLGYVPKRGPSKRYRFFHANSGQGRIAIVFADGSEASLRVGGIDPEDLGKRADADYGPDWSAKYVMPALMGDALGPFANCLACLGVPSRWSPIACATCGGTAQLPEAEMASVREAVWQAVKDSVADSRLLSAGHLRRLTAAALTGVSPGS